MLNLLHQGLACKCVAARRAVPRCVRTSVFTALFLTFFSGISAQAQNVHKIMPSIHYLLFDDRVGGETMSPAEAARFLIQSTFGPTYEDIVNLSNSSFERWLDQQFALPVTRTEDYAESQNWITNYPLILSRSADSSMLNVMLSAPDQLRQRVAYALSQIFVVSRNISNGFNERPLYYLAYYDMLAENAFGNYRELLEDVTLNSVMGAYLSHAMNAKTGSVLGPFNARYEVISPDENYAREVMQLFSIGLVKLNIDGTPELQDGATIPTYTQQTIENFARVFTGWNHDMRAAGGTEFNNLGIPVDVQPMRSWDEYHDQQAKVLLDGQTLPANQTAVEDLNGALDVIFNHPNVGPFISKQLIQHMVTANPTPAYVERVARVFNNNGQGERGDLKAVIKAILLDNEARNGHQSLPNQFGKYKEPFIRQLALWRGMYARRQNNNNLFNSYYDNFLSRLRQKPLWAPSVFNFYEPDFSPPGVLQDAELLAPVSQLFDTESVVAISTTYEEFVQRFHDDANNDFATSPSSLLLNTQPFQNLVPDNLRNPEDLIERLNLVFLGGAMSDEMRQVLLEVHDPSLYLVEDKWGIVIDLVNIIMLSPQYWVQR